MRHSLPRPWSLLATLALLMLAAAACRPAAAPDVALASGALANHLTRLAPPVQADSLSRARHIRYVADSFRSSGLQPVLGRSFLLPHAASARDPAVSAGSARDASRAHVMGYQAGQDPNVSATLVLVTSHLHDAGTPAVLEVARVLAQEASVTIVPGATVGFAVWTPPRTAASGAADFVARPPWALDGVVRVLHVATDTSGADAMRTVWAEVGIPFETVELPRAPGGLEPGREQAVRLGEAYRLAAATLDLVRRAAAAPGVGRSAPAVSR